MSNRIAIVAAGTILVGLSALARPAAAQVYDDGGYRPVVGQAWDDGPIDGARGRRGGDHRVRARDDVGPVVYDERDPGRRGRGWRDGDDGPAFRGEPRPVYGYDLRGVGPAFGRPIDRGDGGVYRGPNRSLSVPIDYEPVGERSFAVDVGCTTEQSRSTTPAGWRKVVTHRVCYRR